MSETMLKMCSRCHEVKDESTCFRWLNKQNRYIAYCKQCEKEYDQAYQKERRANKALLLSEGIDDVLNQFCEHEGITREELNNMSKKGDSNVR